MRPPVVSQKDGRLFACRDFNCVTETNEIYVPTKCHAPNNQANPVY